VNAPRLGGALFLALAVLAGALRFPALAARPMHADEAVHADKLGTLVEGGGYAYDPTEHHGPTLYYLTLLAARLQGARRYVEVDEVTLRSVPAAVGTALVAAHVLARPLLGPAAALMAALLAAISPAMVYYSRYYIHEMLLVAASFLALAAVCRYLLQPRAGWALAAGAAAGLMLATKETAPLALGSMLAGLAAADLAGRAGRGEAAASLLSRVRGRDALSALAAALAVGLVLLTSFLQRPAGAADAARAYGIYLERATAATWHIHPWHYYLGLLAHFPVQPPQGRPFWSEGLILALAAVGGVSAWRGTPQTGADPRLLRVLAGYTLLMLVSYSAIPYKTPWCLLGFLHGMILLAGAGAVGLVRCLRSPAARALAVVLLAAAAAQLGWQARAASFRFAADPGNPYVYAHTGPDVFRIAERLEGLARAHAGGLAMPLQVVSRENLWPLPFYLRRMTGVRWWNGVSDEAPLAPVVVLTPDLEPALVRRLYEVPPPGERELYVSAFELPVELRPALELRAYAAASLWERYRRAEPAAADASARSQLAPGAVRETAR
jgi:uncharacterized protein (TIGR03663 family)